MGSKEDGAPCRVQAKNTLTHCEEILAMRTHPKECPGTVVAVEASILNVPKEVFAEFYMARQIPVKLQARDMFLIDSKEYRMKKGRRFLSPRTVNVARAGEERQLISPVCHEP
jgi:hypothetical protein